MRTSLTTKPLLLFLWVVVVIGYLCLPVKSYAVPLTATTNAVNFDILNTTMEHFENATQEWQSVFTTLPPNYRGDSSDVGGAAQN